MSSGGLAGLLAGAVILLALGVVLVGGLAGGTVEVTQSSFQLPDPPSDITQGVVTERRSEGGNSLFGWQFDQPELAVNIWLIAPAECVGLDGDVESMRNTGECADVVASGPITGSGINAEGNGLYLVRVPVSEACFDAIEVGAPWPPLIAECA